MTADKANPRPGFFSLSHRSLFRRQGLLFLLLLLLAVSMALPYLLYGTVANYLTAAQSSKLDTYGAFTDIYYEAAVAADQAWEGPGQGQLDAFLYQAKGLILSLDQAEKNTGLSLGYIDESSRQLGRVRLLEGRWPKAANELVLTASARTALANPGQDLALGGTILLLDKPWRISGFITDFGRLWSRGQQQIDAGYTPPQILFSQAAFAQILTENPAQTVWRTSLFVREPDSAPALSLAKGQFFYNINSQMQAEEKSYTVPKLYSLVLLLAVFVVQLLFFSLVHQERAPVHRTLQLLGLPGRRSRLLQNYELGLLLTLAFCLSLPVALSLAWLAQRLIRGLGSLDYSFQIDLALLLAWSGRLFLTGLMAIICSRLFTGPGRQLQQKSRTRRQRTSKSLLIWDLRQVKGHFAALLAVILFCAGLFTLNADYNARYQANSPLQENLPSQYLSLDYDYELVVDGHRLGNTQYLDEDTVYQVGQQLDDPVSFFTDQYGFGASQAYLDQLTAIAGLGQVRAYRQINQVYLAVHNPADPWLDGLDGSFDGLIKQDLPLFYQEADARAHGLPELTLPVRLSGYPEEELLELAQKANEGQLDLAAVRRGEAAILIVPDYFLEKAETENGFYYVLRQDDLPEKGVVRYQDQAVGEQLDLYGIFCNERIWGQVSRTDYADFMQFFHKKIKIAAIIRQPAGEFDTIYGPPSQITIAMLNDSFLALDLPANYVRIRANLDQAADALAVDAAILHLSAENPVMPLNNLRLQMADYRVYALFLSYFLSLLNGILLFIGLLVLLSLSSSRLAARRQDYILLRLNGFSLRRWGLFWAIQNGLALLISFLLFFTSLFLVNIGLFLLELSRQPAGTLQLQEHKLSLQFLLSLHYLKGSQWLYPWLVMAACLVLLTILSVRRLRSFGLKPTA